MATNSFVVSAQEQVLHQKLNNWKRILLDYIKPEETLASRYLRRTKYTYVQVLTTITRQTKET